jgi:outer membrane scaffolding protein for murein synthesis (MipA/OmpV family)
MRENNLGIDRLILVVVLLVMEPLKADEWTVKGRIDQDLSYDDNVTMRKESEASFIYAITPELNFSHRTDVSEISANASYGYQKYEHIPRLDRQNQNYGIDGRYFTDTTVWGVSAQYSLTPSRDTAEQDSGDFSSNSEKEMIFISPSVSYRLSEQDKLLLSAQYSDTSYSTAQLVGYRDWGVNLMWSRQWSERYTSSLDVFYSNFDSERSSSLGLDRIGGFGSQTESDSFGANLSSTYLFSENWTIFGTVGVRLTETRRSSLLGSAEKDSSEGFLLDAGVDYEGESLFAKFNISQSLMPSSRGQLNDQFKVELDLNYKVTERLSASLLSHFQKIDPADNYNGGGDKRTNITVNPSISLMITPDWILSTSYRYRYQKSIREDEETAHSNLYMMSLNYSWQGLSMAR